MLGMRLPFCVYCVEGKGLTDLFAVGCGESPKQVAVEGYRLSTPVGYILERGHTCMQSLY